MATLTLPPASGSHASHHHHSAAWPGGQNIREPKGWFAVDAVNRSTVFDVIDESFGLLSGSVAVTQIRTMPDKSLAIDVFPTRKCPVTAELLRSIRDCNAQIIDVVCDLKLQCGEEGTWQGAIVIYVSTAAHAQAYPDKSNVPASSEKLEKSDADSHHTIKFHTSASRWHRPSMVNTSRHDEIVLRELARSLIALQGERAHAGSQRIFELASPARTFQICTTDFWAPLTIQQIMLAAQLAHKEAVHVDFSMMTDEKPGALVFTCRLPSVVRTPGTAMLSKRSQSSNSDRDARRIRRSASSGPNSECDQSESDSESSDDETNHTARNLRQPSGKRAVRFSDSQDDSSPFRSVNDDVDEVSHLFAKAPAPAQNGWVKRLFGFG